VAGAAGVAGDVVAVYHHNKQEDISQYIQSKETQIQIQIQIQIQM